jgi:hypothetical protein
MREHSSEKDKRLTPDFFKSWNQSKCKYVTFIKKYRVWKIIHTKNQNETKNLYHTIASLVFLRNSLTLV